jgi:hypothetical protein
MSDKEKLEAIWQIIEELKDADYSEVEAGLNRIEQILNT